MIRKILRFVLWAAAIYAAVVALLIVVYLIVPPVSTLMMARWVTGHILVIDAGLTKTTR